MFFWDSNGEINLWLQSIVYDPRWFLPVTFAGEELFYSVLIPFVYFTLNRRAGVTLLLAQLLTNSINILLKLIFHEPRPFWVTVMHVFAFEDSYGLPSGDAQNAVVVWGYLAFFLVKEGYMRKATATSLAVIWVFLIGVSRIVLGVHFIQDTLLGWTVGLLLLFFVIRYEDAVRQFYLERTPSGRFFIIAMTAVLLLEAAALIASTQNVPQLSDWNETARLSIASTSQSGLHFADLNPTKMKSFLNVAGCLFGLYAAHSLKDVGYAMPVLFRNRLVVLIPGLVMIFLVYIVLSAIFPKSGVEGGLLRILRYALVVFTGLYVYPWMVDRIRRNY